MMGSGVHDGSARVYNAGCFFDVWEHVYRKWEEGEKRAGNALEVLVFFKISIYDTCKLKRFYRAMRVVHHGNQPQPSTRNRERQTKEQ